MLVDGYHRFEICKDNGIEYRAIGKSFKDRDAAIAWIFDNQKSRRNMSKFLWAEAVVKLKAGIAKEAKKNQEAGVAVCQNSDKPINTLEKLAKIAGISRDTMHRVEFILKEAAANSANENLKKQVDALRKNDKGVSINSVYNELKKIKDGGKVVKPKKPSNDSMRTSPIVRAVKKSSKDSAGQIAFVITALDDIDKEFQKTEAHKDFYDDVIDWASKKKQKLSTKK